ncbi:MAG TPA: hypothetical protein VE987_07535 [Polyangiaceae bacterium]|nr:hypothetical protein [Polyangiaceae bacterium]
MTSPWFINTDLEITSRRDLSDFVAGLGSTVFALYNGPLEGTGGAFFANLELKSSRWREPDGQIRAFLRAIDRAPTSLREVWERARRRRFCLGFYSGREYPAIELQLRPDTLATIAAAKAEVSIAVYPLEPEDTRTRARTRRS